MVRSERADRPGRHRANCREFDDGQRRSSPNHELSPQTLTTRTAGQMSKSGKFTAIIAAFLAALLAAALPVRQGLAADSLLSAFLKEVPAGAIVPGADAYGTPRSDTPIVPALKGGQTVGHVFLTSDFVSTTGYSGKSIHVIVGISNDAVLTGVQLVKHSEDRKSVV